MRILQVVHDFLPNHVAGVEVYTDSLSRFLSYDHDVAILFSDVAHDVPNYSIRRGDHHGIATYEIINNYTINRFEQTYVNPKIAERMLEVLDEFRPDVVHIQHLINLSISFVDELHDRGIPVLMTLHDHWLVCANGGQRFRREGGRCDDLSSRRCGECTAHMHGVGLLARGHLQRRREVALGREAALHLTDETPSRIESPDSNFVYRDEYESDGRLQPTLVTHPPALVEFNISVSAGARFESAITLHPETFDKAGGGVRFKVHVDGKLRWERTIDPKRKVADRTPSRVVLELDPGPHLLQLQTEAIPLDAGSYCTGGWIDPLVSRPIKRRRPGSRTARRTLELAASAAARFRWAAQRRRVESRWAAMRRMCDRIDLFVAPSEYLEREFVSWGIDKRRILVSDYGFETHHFTRRGDLPDVARRFAFVGSLVPHKGVHRLLEAFEGMPADAHLDICGSPDYAPEYSAALRSSARHQGIRFVGAIEPAQIAGFLREVDALVVPSIWQENSPLTIHEAFMAGIPVVASRMGGHEGLLAGGGGLLYETDDPSDLTEKLMRLYTEPGLARTLVATAPPVKPMSEQAVELVSIYQDLITNGRA